MTHLPNPVLTPSKPSTLIQRGPLLDDGAPYSAIGTTELSLICADILPHWKPGVYDPLPDQLLDTPFMQYGTGQHASKPKRLVGSVLVPVLSDQNTTINIRHLVVQGSSQWVIGRNITKHCTIERIDGNYLRLPIKHNCDHHITVQLLNVEQHCYPPLSAFGIHSYVHQSSLFYATIQSHHSTTNMEDWDSLRKLLDKVHTHVCGHASYNDIRLLLQRNRIWNPQVESYIRKAIEQCNACRSTSLPKPTRKVSLADIDSALNERVCIDHLFFGW